LLYKSNKTTKTVLNFLYQSAYSPRTTEFYTLLGDPKELLCNGKFDASIPIAQVEKVFMTERGES
jgi:hypothetical protein